MTTLTNPILSSTNPQHQAIVLFAHGSRNPAWRAPFERIALQVAAQTDVSVELAFLELMQPSLTEVLQNLAKAGKQSVSIVPLFFGLGNHVANDLTDIVRSFSADYPKLKIHIAAPLGESDMMIQAMSDYAVQSISNNA